jgi:hypothetical protein
MSQKFYAYLLIENDTIRIKEIIKLKRITKKLHLNLSITNEDIKSLKKFILKILFTNKRKKKELYDYNVYMYLRNSANFTNNALDLIMEEIKEKNQDLLIYGDSVVKISYKNQYWYEARPEWSPIFFENHDFLGDLVIIVSSRELLLTKKNFSSILNLKLSDPEVIKIKIDNAIVKRETNLNNYLGVPKLVSPRAEFKNLNKIYRVNKFDEKITIIIPTNFSKNTKGDSFIKNCLESMNLNATKFNFEVVLLFDGIHGNDYKSLVENKKFNFVVNPIYYTSTKFNFSTVINTGVQNISNDFILILNDDVYFESKFSFDCPLKHLIYDAAGTVGVRLLHPDLRIQHAGIYFQNKVPQHWLYGSNKDYLPESHNYCREVSGSTGAFLFFRKSLYEKIGGMDEQFALDYNDVDLCLNMDKHGYKNILCSSITAKHLESATRKKRDVKEIENDLIRLMNKYEIKVRDPYVYTPADRS